MPQPARAVHTLAAAKKDGIGADPVEIALEPGNLAQRQAGWHDRVHFIRLYQSLGLGLHHACSLISVDTGFIHDPGQRPDEILAASRAEIGPFLRCLVTVCLVEGDKRESCRAAHGCRVGS